MRILRVNRKLLLAVGVVGGGVTSALLYSGLKSDGYKTRAENVFENHFNDESNSGQISSFLKWDNDWDRMAPPSPTKPIDGKVAEKNVNKNEVKEEKTKPKPIQRHIILVRHGQYNDDETTDSLRTLTPLGREQANLVGLRLKELGFPYTRIIQSSMTRAKETAEIISKHLPGVPVTTSDLLREGYPIRYEPPSLRSKLRPERLVFKDGAQIEAAFRKYFHRPKPTQKEDSYEILVCHGNVIRYLLCRALQFQPNAWIRFHLHHSSWTWIMITPDGQVAVFAVGDYGHLPKNKISNY